MPREQKDPTHIYAILAYSKTLNKTKQEFDEDALRSPYKHTTLQKLAEQKAESFASRLNATRHKGATDWVGQAKRQPYKPSGLVRASQIKPPRNY